jgi:hypothetical protein
VILNVVKSYPFVKMDDLHINLQHGWAYQPNPVEIDYSKDYFENYIKYENSKIGKELNNFRCEIAQKYSNNILDIGIGSGTFLKQLEVKKAGFDINPFGVEWLNNQNLFFDPYAVSEIPFDCITFWDVIEHIQEPINIFKRIKKGAFLITSIPIFDSIEKVHLSKHYKPNEHLYYFTTKGFVWMMGKYGFDFIEIRSDETRIGRENILTFVFRR